MHSYLRAIGYSQTQNRADAEQLVAHVLEQASEKRITRLPSGAALVEASMECADGIGITVRGEFDAKGDFHLEHYFPYFRGSNVSMHEDVYISKRVDTDAYNGMCDDSRLGVSLIFYLQNVIDYIESRQGPKDSVLHPVTLSALALDGKILLPAVNNVLQQQSITAKNRQRSQLVSEAKKGNKEALESLTIEDIDLYSVVSVRIKQEDVYCIVDTTFIPYGTESDVYTILGYITAVRPLKNNETGDELYSMQLNCNDVLFDLCINKADLFGEPAVGMRFRGTVWMQGSVDFLRT